MHPPVAPLPPPAPASERVASVDVLRGLVITLMVFVNDVAGVPHAPLWLKHVDASADGMTLPDIVFPAFLFIAGVSIPLALERARARGQSDGRILARVVSRVLALLAMGVVMVNGEEHEPWPRGLWNTLAFASMFLAFAVVPENPGRTRRVLRLGRWVGAIALAALVLAHRGSDGRALVFGPLFDSGDTVWLRHSWWGILGLIGWAYLVASLVYLACGRRREWLVGCIALLMLLPVAVESDLGGRLASRPWLGWAGPAIDAVGALLAWINGHVGLSGTLGTQAGLTVAGVCLGAMLVRGRDLAAHTERIRWALVFAAGLAAAGLLLDAPHGINKIRATPAWCLYCAALTTIAWAALYRSVDVRPTPGWTALVRPAGANPLLAYLLHPFLLLLVGLIGGPFARVVFSYRTLPAPLAVLGSLAMALLVVQATGWIAARGYRLRV